MNQKSPKPSKETESFFSFGWVIFIFFVLCCFIQIPRIINDPGRHRKRPNEQLMYFSLISRGALKWYGEQRANASGELIPRHFPSAASPSGIASGSYTNPPQKPCADGNALYSKNGEIWDKQPWKSLQFEIKKAHYAQYTYTVNNDKKSPSFTVTALADLDCDGIFSTYRMTGTQAASGEIVRSRVTMTKKWE